MKPILSLSQWESRVRDCFSATRSFKSTQPELSDRIDSSIYSELNRKHGKRAVYPAYVRGYVGGLKQSEREHMFREWLEFCYIVDGVLYSVRDNTGRKTTRFYCESVNPKNGGQVLCSEETPRGFFWIGSNKRYF
jgi:hypothetical protein